MSQTIQLGPREIDALARIAVAEAEIDGTRGMQAVVATILNRAAANKGYFGGTDIIDIINKPRQFSPVTPVGHVERLPQAPESVEHMVAEFASTFSRQSDPTNGATFFRNAAQTRGNAQDRNSNITARIGGHTFYGSYGTGARVELPDEVSVSLAEPVAQRYGIATTPTPPDMPRDFSVFQGARTSVRGNFQRGTPLSDYVEKGTATPFQGVVAHTVGVANARPGSLARNMRENLQGYSFVVDKDGSVYQTASLSDRTNHVKDITSRTLTRPDLSNANAIGIAFNVKTPDEITPAMEQAARGLVMDLADRGVIPSAGEVYAHTELQEEKNPEEGLSFARSMRSEFGVPDPVPVSEERFAEVMAQRRADIDGAVSPTRTAQAPATGPILTDETSLLTPYADGGTARLSQMAGITPPARPTDLAARPDISNRTLAGYQDANTTRVRSGASDMRLAASAQSMLDAIAERNIVPEISVISGYRDPDRNARARGARNSQHMRGTAIDIDGRNMTDAQRQAVVATAIANGARGVGVYPGGSIHLDTRSTPAIWGPGQDRFAGVPVSAMPAWAQPVVGPMMDGRLMNDISATPPSPTQAVAARARNPANMTAFVEPPEPAARPAAQPARVAAAPATTMTDVAQNAPPLADRTLQGYSRATTGQGIPTRAETPASSPAASQLSYAPDVTRGMTTGNRFGDGSFGIAGPQSAVWTRGATNLRGLTADLPGVYGELSDFSRLTNTPQAQARTGSPSVATRDVTRIGASAPMVDMSPLTPPSVARPAQPPVDFPTVGMPAPRSVRTVSVGPVPGTIPGARPPSAPAPVPAPPPAHRQAPMPAPLPPERPAFIPNNPNAPRPVRAFESGIAGIGNFVERNTRGFRSSLNDRYGDYYGGDMFAPNYNTGNDIIDFINLDAAMRGPGAPNLFDAYERDFGGMSRGGRLGGSLIGGALAGPPGAIVGGLLGGTVGDQMGFGRDRREAEQTDNRSLLDAIGDFFGGLGGLGGTDLGGESRDSDEGSRRSGGIGTPEPGMGIGGSNWN